MAGISIPGVTDKYKSNDIVESLMKVERIPLTREQENLDSYKEQQSAWRSVNSNMSSLRSSAKTLYSFDNPFNNKLTESSDERAVSATASRNAEYESFKIDVIKPASSDRFMSGELEKDYSVPKGTYTFKINDKEISFKWNGGKLKDFISSLNRRGNNLIKADTIGTNNGKLSLLIESLKTGEENHLEFKNDALSFAKEIEMLGPVKSEANIFGTKLGEFREVPKMSPIEEQQGLPEISYAKVFINEKGTIVPPRSGFTLDIPEKFRTNGTINFSATDSDISDVTGEINEAISVPDLPDAGEAEFQGITIANEPSQTSLPNSEIEGPVNPVDDTKIVFVKFADGSEKIAENLSVLANSENERTDFSLNTNDYPGITSIVIRNRNTAKQLTLSPFSAYDSKTSSGFGPLHPVSTAGDAEIKYEGITIRRPENSIDDVVPDVTLNIKNATKETATITILPDKESAKNALIEFVGKYNQTIAELNILSQNKPEIVEELEYLSPDEKEAKQKVLGMFLSDFSLTNAKNQLQNIIASQYKYSETAVITMLDQIGISTNASGGGGYTPSRLRGYLESDEKKLDANIENHLDELKNLFGYDSDGDMIIDSGIAYSIDRQLTAYVQSGGIIAGKTNSLDGKIKTSESKIARLETQLNQKESELRAKYGQMESTLNSLESQQNSISNFSNSLNKK